MSTKLHTCKACHNGNEATPLEFAQGTLRLSWWEVEYLMRDYPDAWAEGWLMGVEGAIEFRPMPIGGGAPNMFLLGLAAGRYAADNDWLGPVCKGHDREVAPQSEASDV